jgi:serine/threonine protein phosphatase 1
MSATGARPRKEPGGPVFAIGDVHGCAAELELLLQQLPLTPDTTLIFVGDYIDRGPQSREVIETLLELRERCAVVGLLGNHEAMFLEFQDEPQSRTAGMFIYNGGSCTLASYANDVGEYRIPAEHVAFVRGLKLHHEIADYFCVHAGVPPLPLEGLNLEQWRDELLWTREMTETTYSWSKVIVHGHCQRPEPDQRPNHINVDTGCVYDGKLTALELTTRQVHSVPRQQREAPRYLRDIRSRRRAIRFQGSIPVCLIANGMALHCLTVNYSEVGMYLRWLTPSLSPKLDMGQRVTGIIGAAGPAQVRFWGHVVRCDDTPDGPFYAVMIEAAVGC